MDLCNGIAKEGCIPEDLNSTLVLPVYEGKGDPMECGNLKRDYTVETCYKSDGKDF